MHSQLNINECGPTAVDGRRDSLAAPASSGGSGRTDLSEGQRSAWRSDRRTRTHTYPSGAESGAAGTVGANRGSLAGASGEGDSSLLSLYPNSDSTHSVSQKPSAATSASAHQGVTKVMQSSSKSNLDASGMRLVRRGIVVSWGGLYLVVKRARMGRVLGEKLDFMGLPTGETINAPCGSVRVLGRYVRGC